MPSSAALPGHVLTNVIKKLHEGVDYTLILPLALVCKTWQQAVDASVRLRWTFDACPHSTHYRQLVSSNRGRALLRRVKIIDLRAQDPDCSAEDHLAGLICASELRPEVIQATAYGRPADWPYDMAALVQPDALKVLRLRSTRDRDEPSCALCNWGRVIAQGCTSLLTVDVRGFADTEEWSLPSTTGLLPLQSLIVKSGNLLAGGLFATLLRSAPRLRDLTLAHSKWQVDEAYKLALLQLSELITCCSHLKRLCVDALFGDWLDGQQCVDLDIVFPRLRTLSISATSHDLRHLAAYPHSITTLHLRYDSVCQRIQDLDFDIALIARQLMNVQCLPNLRTVSVSPGHDYLEYKMQMGLQQLCASRPLNFVSRPSGPSN